MYLLIGIAFLAGIITILSPCILPVLPIVLTGATIDDKKYPFGVVLGFILSFTIFTLFLTSLVNLTGISANAVRYISIVVIGLFGLVLLVPKLQAYFEILVSKLVSKVGSNKKGKQTGFISGVFVGTSMGLIWTPCVGPILGSVIALALSGSVNGYAFVITLAYALGTAIPMFAIMWGGRALLKKIPWLLNNLGKIQKVFGILLLIVALSLIFNWDRQFQTYITQKFPQYGAGLTKIEDNDAIQKALDQTFGGSQAETEAMRPAPELIGTGEWFNSDPLALADLRGKVVLIDFWTYSCINCIRTFPYIQAWHEKYADDGLVIIAVHTPEFEFEKSPSNLQKAINDFGLTYRVVQDNDYKTWRAYENRYWPAKFFIDAEGNIRRYHKGEGEYQESEEFIRMLLEEAGAELDEDTLVEDPNKDRSYKRTPETYLGHRRIKNFVSPEGVTQDQQAEYTAPTALQSNEFAYKGLWTIAGKYALAEIGSSLHLNFTAKNVFLVMNPTVEGERKPVEVYIDGELNKTVNVDADQLYTLVELEAGGEHLLELKFPEGGVEVYAFTFG